MPQYGEVQPQGRIILRLDIGKFAIGGYAANNQIAAKHIGQFTIVI